MLPLLSYTPSVNGKGLRYLRAEYKCIEPGTSNTARSLTLFDFKPGHALTVAPGLTATYCFPLALGWTAVTLQQDTVAVVVS